MNNLRTNQKNAINESLKNDFQSGIHYHATGTGKSWIAMNIILQFHNKYPKNNIMWICEKKSILVEQFNISNLRERHFENINKEFNILNFSEFKLKNWYNSINSSIFWNKPVLLIINRAFLTYDEKYKKIKLPFHLIIHDECHSIINKTTQQFYEYILKCDIIPKCIGFSATPNLNYKPFDNIISSYSIYDAFINDVIVPPKIKWFSCDTIINYTEIASLVSNQINDPNIIYKKIIIWCGMIDLCIDMANLWSNFFAGYMIAIDTSKEIEGYSNYHDFEKIESRALLFCAAKHREGSDIKNLDCCVFLDKVEKRCPRVFVQCIGRVLRKDKANLKKYGLIIDVRAKSSLLICNNLNNYLNLPCNLFPWKFDYESMTINNKLVKISSLKMTHKNYYVTPDIKQCSSNNNVETYSIEVLKKLFIRNIPNSDLKNLNIYSERLNFELEMLESKNLISHLIQAMHILNITKNIPHVTRGSCGSSLVCYLLGISHIDPVINNIKFARFLTEYRKNLPDIDLDFPHNMRDEVFLKIGLTWPGKVARISNHVYFHDKSALRKALRNAGICKFIGKDDLQKEINKLPKSVQAAIKKDKESLENTFNCYSLHCGGIVYYPEGVPEELLLQSKSETGGINKPFLQQVMMNKHDVAKDKNFKIDILSSRALSQCYEINKYKPIPFEEFSYDQKTFDMLKRGDNIGIILAESPLIRKAFIKIKPKSIHDLAICLSIIRPAAMDAKNSDDLVNFDDNIIFDDDAITMIGQLCNIDDELADKYRRAFSKGDKEGIAEFKNLIAHFPKEKQKEIMTKLANLSRYSFCKSHAYSYAQLIWKLAYMKANNETEFWKATLNNCCSSYRKWVHYYEARLAGVSVTKELLKKDDVSIYANNRRKKIQNLNYHEQLQKYGYWIMNSSDFFPGCFLNIVNDVYHFNGIIASLRLSKGSKKSGSKLLLFIGVGKKQYMQVIIENLKYFDRKSIGIIGYGKSETLLEKECNVVHCKQYKFY